MTVNSTSAGSIRKAGQADVITLMTIVPRG